MTCLAKSYLKNKNQYLLTHGSQTITEAPNTHKGKCLSEEVIYGKRGETKWENWSYHNVMKSGSTAGWELRSLVCFPDFLDWEHKAKEDGWVALGLPV